MRATDEQKHPAAIERERKDMVRTIAGLVIAAAGLAAVFWFREVYVGFSVALLGAGIVPVDRVAGLLKR